MLVIEGISKSFGGLQALSHVSLTMGDGEIVGLIGPNGAGKTTLIEVISGFYPPNGGTIHFNGERIDGLKPHLVFKKGLARSFQLAEFPASFTLFEFVLFSALARHDLVAAREQTKRTLASLDLTAQADMPIAALIPATQRLAEVARVLNSGARMLLLDEIMAGLTDDETAPVMARLKELNALGISLLVIEHRLEVISELCPRVVVLNFGQKIADGPAGDVMQDPKVVAAYLGEEA